MASPIGHTLVGLGLTAALAQVYGLDMTPPLWVGAAVASNLPDLDWFGVLAGLPRRLVHRSASHSLLTLTAAILFTTWLVSLRPVNLNLGFCVTWSVVLLSHPLVDVVTTSPGAAAAGFGIPLLWPLMSRRWSFQLVRTHDLLAARTIRTLGTALFAELAFSVPAFLILCLAGYTIRLGAQFLQAAGPFILPGLLGN